MSVRTHLLTTGICAELYLHAPSSETIIGYLSDKMHTSIEGAIHIVSYLCAVHDIGKMHPAFQKKNPNWQNGLGDEAQRLLLDAELIQNGFRHEYYSGEVMRRIWKKRGMKTRTCMIWSTVLSIHHQKPKPKMQLPPKNETWIFMQNEMEEEMATRFLQHEQLSVPDSVDSVCMLVSAIIVLMDWVSSSSLLEDAEGRTEHEIREKAKYALNLYGLISESVFPQISSFRSMWPFITSPRPLQIACDMLSADAPLTIVEAPMGEGKTEAALYQAARQCNHDSRRGIYMALPSQATSNQMHDRMDDMLKGISYGESRLLHGTAFLREELQTIFHTEDERTASIWTRPTRMGLLGANAVGTVDQAMSAVLLSRFSMIRLAGLMNKTLIIDEIHAYDMYMSEILEILLHWCRSLNIPVILLSATMRQVQKQRYLSCFGIDKIINNDYPMITQVDRMGNLLQIPIESAEHRCYLFQPYRIENDDDIIGRALEKTAHGGCLAILVNSVSRAQSIFERLQEKATTEIEVILFHSRFTVQNRSVIEEKCIRMFGRDRSNRPAKAILVATQVVEQSIDLDFDGMISELAPIDLLLQRAGRLHRHQGNERPQGMTEPILEVILPPASNSPDLEHRYGISGFIYDPFLLYNTEGELERTRKIRIPEDVRAIIENVYRNMTDENREAWLKRHFQGELMTAQAKGISWPVPMDDSFFPAEGTYQFSLSELGDGFESASEASTRLGDESVRVSFCTEKEFERLKQGQMDQESIRRAYLNSASIRIAEIHEDKDVFQIHQGKLNGIWCLRGETEAVITGRRIINDATIGIRWEGNA